MFLQRLEKHEIRNISEIDAMVIAARMMLLSFEKHRICDNDGKDSFDD